MDACGGSGLRRRESDDERRARPVRANRELTVMSFRDTFHDRETEPRTRGLRREEWLEDSRLRFVRYPTAVVRDFDSCSGPTAERVLLDTHDDASPLRHRLHGVVDEVDHRTANETGVEEQWRKRARHQ